MASKAGLFSRRVAGLIMQIGTLHVLLYIITVLTLTDGANSSLTTQRYTHVDCRSVCRGAAS